MPDIGKALREEIARVAQRETKSINVQMKKGLMSLQREISDLRKLLNKPAPAAKAASAPKPKAQKVSMPKAKAPAAKADAKARSVKVAMKPKAKAAPKSGATDKKVWFTPKGIKSMRERLGVSQEDFGKVCGVSKKTVSTWELSKQGKLNLRPSNIEGLSKARTMTPSAAKQALVERKTV